MSDRAAILVVDDREENLIAFEAVLGRIAEVITARSGQQALERARDRELAVILMDVMMPEMDGFETASLLRKRENTKSTPIVFITAATPDESRTFQGYSLGAVDFLYKPVSDRLLYSKIKVFVDLYLSGKELEREHLSLVKQQWESERLRAEIEKERKNAQTSALFRLFVESVMDYAVFTLDREGHITTWNAGAERILGYSEREILGRNFSTIFSPEDVASKIPERELERAAAFGRADDFRWHMRKDGSRFWAEGVVTPLKMDGTLVGYCKLLRDYTGRKREEERLENSEASYRNTFRIAGVGNCHVDAASARFLNVNERFCEITGYSEEELLKMTILDITHPEEREEEKKRFRALVEGRTKENAYEKRYIRKDGQLVWVLLNARMVRDKNGNPLHSVSVVQDITDRKNTEQRLAESEARFRLLMENISEYAIFTVSRDGKFSSWSPGVERVLGYKENEFIGRHCELIFTAEDNERKAAERILRSAETDGVVEERRWHVRKGGDRFWANGIVTALKDNEGRFRGFAKVLRDETERKRFEDALKKSKETLDLAVEAAAIGIWDWNFETGEIEWSDSARKLFGVPPHAPITIELCLSIIHPDDRRRVEEVIQRAIDPKGDGRCLLEYRIRPNDGEDERWVIIRGRVHFDGEGKPVRLVGTVTDITQRKRNEALLVERARLLDLSYDAILARDEEDRIAEWNRGAEELYGWEKQEAIGKRVHELLKTVFPKPLAEIKEDLRRTGRWEGELTHEKKDGTRITVMSRWAVERGGTVKSGMVLESNTDITEKKRTEDALAAALREVAESNAELEQFAYVASHDMKEPLRMISSYLALLARRYKGRLETDADEFIDFALDGANRMQALIDNLLAYARVGQGAKRFKKVDCQGVLETALRNLRLAIEESRAEITADPLPVVEGDATQLIQLFQNLIGNAIKFRKEAPPKIHIWSEGKGEEWLFCVTDEGIGLDMQYAERIFGVFQRLHARHQYPGSGIGLATCRKIVERHGGRIWVDSEPDKGSKFFFTIPRARS